MLKNEIHILSAGTLPIALAEEAREKHIVLDMLSFIDIQTVEPAVLRQQIGALSAQALTVVFTSSNAVRAVIAQQEHPPQWKIYCTSGATKETIKDFWGAGCIAGYASSAAKLAMLISRDSHAKDIIFFCGDRRRDELPDLLRSKSMKVQEVFVYRTVHTPHKIMREYQGILFFSPSAADSFFSINRVPVSTTLFAIGNTTAKAIRRYCSNPVITSSEPGKNLLAKLAIQHFARA